MNKTIFLPLLISLFSLMVFGQSYDGSYKAEFISLEKGRNPSVEFEIQSSGFVNGKIFVDESVTMVKGQVNDTGNLEAKSEVSTDGTIYTLKADMRRSDGKITLTSRNDKSTFGKQAISSALMQGSFSKVEKSNTGAAPSSSFSTRDRSELFIEQPNPLFEKGFSGAQAKIIIEKDSSFNIYNLQMSGETDTTERGFYFSLARLQGSSQTVWKAENIRAVNYVEKTEKFTKINRFRSDSDRQQLNRRILSGQIEIISESARRITFKVIDLRIKNESNSDIVTINGMLYADVSK